MMENRSSGSGRHFPMDFTLVFYSLGSQSFDLSGPSYMIASTLVGRAEAPGHCSVSCKGTEKLESYKFRETQWMVELNVSFEITPAFEVCLV